MKNTQVIDSAENAMYDIFAATEPEFSLLFGEGEDIAFIEDVFANGNSDSIQVALNAIWARRVRKKYVAGIHGTLFYDLQHKKKYYPSLRDEYATNPDGSSVR